jgi:proteasome lid subunit RPN8/RPN11
MNVYRRTELPQRPARGRLLVAEGVLAPTRAALQSSSTSGRPDEGLVLWLGRTIDDTTVVLGCAAPRTTSTYGSVSVSESTVGSVAAAGRTHGLGLIAQVHSHPGRETRHSDGDDRLVLMPFESMFSVVIADYGAGSVEPSGGAGLHQFQDGQWVQIENNDALIVVPALITVTP